MAEVGAPSGHRGATGSKKRPISGGTRRSAPKQRGAIWGAHRAELHARTRGSSPSSRGIRTGAPTSTGAPRSTEQDVHQAADVEPMSGASRRTREPSTEDRITEASYQGAEL